MAPKKILHVLSIVDGVSEETVDFIGIRGFLPKDYYEQFDVDITADPHMLDRYSVGPDEAAFLATKIQSLPAFDFQRFAYFLEPVSDD